MKWIGLTGGIACGKSSVARWLRDQGIDVVDADDVAHQALRPGESSYVQIVHLFGPNILNQDGTINRQHLGKIVFSDSSKLEMLERIAHPWVQARVKQERQNLEKLGKEMAFYDVPLLFEKKLEKQFDAIIVVACDEKIQIDRLQKRNGFNVEESMARIRAQMPLADKISRTPYVLWNNGTLQELEEQAQDILDQLKKNV